MNAGKAVSFRGQGEEGPPSERREGGELPKLSSILAGRTRLASFSFRKSGGSEAVALLLLPHVPLLRKCANSHDTASVSGHSVLRTAHAKGEGMRGVPLQGQQTFQTHNVTLF